MGDPKKRKDEPEATVFVSDSGKPARGIRPDDPTVVDGAWPPGVGTASDTIAGEMLGAVLVQPGAVLANRYKIINLLGEGGMGAVYKARDLELEREVALKVIRSELANNPDILQRFKQELILARQVTDRNVIRIFDLGEAGRIKFITMEYVEGEGLHQIIKGRGKLDVAEAVGIAEQVAKGLAAVHREGVIHRDLKPSNILRDKHGRVVVMDFGLARSLVGDGMTRTGAMMGTIEYMSPEQAQGKELKPSSDIFAVGLILYEMLSGIAPFHADTAIASLLKRTQQRAVPLVDIDKKIPGVLSNIVCKCLEKDPERRYQTAEELVADLRAWQGTGGRARVSASSTRLWMNRLRELSWKRIAVTAFLTVLTATGIALYLNRRWQTPPRAVAHVPVSVLVADFQNNTGDSIFDDTLEPMFNVALEGASFINAFSRGTAREVAAALPNPNQTLNEQTARLVAVKEGIATVVHGTLNKRGSGYDLSVKAIDAVTGKTLASADATTANKDELLLEVPKLAAPIRRALGDTTPKSVQLAAGQGSFTVGNLQAVHEYGVAKAMQASGKLEEALQAFSKAAELDPNFARAYAGMAATAGNLGQTDNAEKFAKLAMEHVDRMTERERYRVRGQYYIRTENWKKCVEENSELVAEYPADDIGQTNLAMCYAHLLNMPKATQVARQDLQISPNDAMSRMNYALYSCYANDFQSCEHGGNEVLQLNPKYEEAFLVVADAKLGQGQLVQAIETYHKLEKVSSRGKSLAASGLANVALYQGRFREGIQILEKGAAADIAEKNPDSAADKFLMLAYSNLSLGQRQAAAAAAERALTNSQSTKVRFLAGRTLVEAGETAKARKLAVGLAAEVHAEPQAYAKLILGEAALKNREPNQAIRLFTEAKDLLDTWIGRSDLGRAYLQAEAFGEADSEFDRCIRRRGEALELFMDNMPTYSYLPVIYYYQGRGREGLKSRGFADSYRTYLSIRGQSTEDPLVSEIRRKLHE